MIAETNRVDSTLIQSTQILASNKSWMDSFGKPIIRRVFNERRYNTRTKSQDGLSGNPSWQHHLDESCCSNHGTRSGACFTHT